MTQNVPPSAECGSTFSATVILRLAEESGNCYANVRFICAVVLTPARFFDFAKASLRMTFTDTTTIPSRKRVQTKLR
jgi:hypothetical protein